MSRLEELSERYGEHHRARRGREFVFGGEERATLFRELVGGPGRRVLDLGCRYGALTKEYAAGNDVVGVDVDREALAEARRVLRPGGRLVGSVPNAYRLKNRLRFLLGRAPESDPTHLHMFSPSDVRALLHDFSDVELHLISSRFLRVHPRLLANDIVFVATKRR